MVGSGEAENVDYLIRLNGLGDQQHGFRYLDATDHYIKETLRAPAYLRYVDDLVVLGRDKRWLHEIRDRIRERLAEDRLRLHPRKAHIYHTARGIDLFGYQVFPHRRRLRSDNGHRFRRRLKTMARLYGEGALDWGDVKSRISSWVGHAIHGETEGGVRSTEREAPSFDGRARSFERGVLGSGRGVQRLERAASSLERGALSFDREGLSFDRGVWSFERDARSMERGVRSFEGEAGHFDGGAWSFKRRDRSFGRSFLQPWI